MREIFIFLNFGKKRRRKKEKEKRNIEVSKIFNLETSKLQAQWAHFGEMETIKRSSGHHLLQVLWMAIKLEGVGGKALVARPCIFLA